jgi:uncharacterized membrane protein
MRRGWHGGLPYGLALCGTVVLAVTALDVHAPLLRVPLGLVFLCLGPGLVLVHPLDLGEAYIVLTVAAALSLALDMVVATLLLYSGHWSPTLATLVLVGVTVCGAGVDAIVTLRRARDPAAVNDWSGHAGYPVSD